MKLGRNLMVLLVKMWGSLGERIVSAGKGVTGKWVWDLVWKRWGCKGGDMWMEGTLPSLEK